MTKIRTAGERYRELLAERQTAEPTYDVVSPSGATWTMRRISVPTYVATGKLPLSVAVKIAEMTQGGTDADEVLGKLSIKEQFETLRFMQYLLQQAVVDPKIVAEATNDDEIDAVLPEDFAFLINEIAGGAEAERLGNFRHGQSGSGSLAGARSKAFRKKAQ